MTPSVPGLPGLTVRPIVHTAHTQEYVELLATLGGHVASRSPQWSLVAFGGGRVAVHELFPGVSEGEVRLGFEVADLDGYVAAVADRLPEGCSVRLVDADHGRAARVTGRDGLTFFIDAMEPVEGAAPVPESFVKQLWVSTDVEGAAGDLEALGLTRRLTETNGRGVDLDAGSGATLVHIADEGVVGATYEVDVPDLAAAQGALLAAGHRPDLIDESHGRTLKVPLPGGTGMLWVVTPDDDPVGVVHG